MAIRSRYKAICRKCGGKISVGDYIENENGIWVHSPDCPSVVAGVSNVVRAFDIINTETNVPDIPTEFVPSKHQEAIFEYIVNGRGNAVIEAVAGSGKTTTILKALEYLPLFALVNQKAISAPADIHNIEKYKEEYNKEFVGLIKNYRIGFVAFNKSIVMELKKRIPDYVKAMTLHSLGYHELLRNYPDITVDQDKLGGILDKFYPVAKEIIIDGEEKQTLSSETRRKNRILRSEMRRVVSIAKAVMLEFNSFYSSSEALQVIDKYEIEVSEENRQEIVKTLPKVLRKCKANTRTIDYDDMIWIPAVLSLKLQKFDFLFVDEGQDLNLCQMLYISNSLAPNGRVVVVGDRRQALYGFRGADTKALEKMIEVFSAKVFPLSVTYRCPKTHVEMAKKYVPQIESKENAEEGVFGEIDYEKFFQVVEHGDMVVCRVNSPLVSPAFEVIRRKKKATIRGGDIGKSLVEFVKRFEVQDLNNLDVLMTEYVVREYNRYLDEGKELKAETVIERYDTIKAVMKECRDVAELMMRLQMIFSDKSDGVVFSSVHRAKGLEAKRVFVLRPDLFPHPKAKRPWEIEQEKNCYYVAVTRSKSELYFVKGEY